MHKAYNIYSGKNREKKNLKILIETFLKFVTHILGKINPGRYILDELNKQTQDHGL